MAPEFVRVTMGDTCTGQTIAGPGSCTVRYQFTPAMRGLRQATLTVTAGTLTPVSTLFQGLGQAPASLSFTSMTLSFGTGIVGTPTTSSIQLNNTGDVTTGMPSFTASPMNEFSVTMNTCGTSIAAGTGCSVTLAFNAAMTGARSGTLTAMATPGGSSQVVTLTGTGASPGALTISPTMRDFGPMLLGTTPAPFQDFVITNSGSLALSNLVVSVGGTNASSFILSSNPCPSTLNGGSMCTARVTFNPQARGVLSGFIQAVATGSTIQANLQGTGQRPALLTPRSNNLAFGTFVIGGTPPQLPFTLDNTGDVPSGIPSFTSTDTAFTVQPGTCNVAVPAGMSCSGTITFAPTTTTAGAHSTTIDLGANPGGGSSFSATGTGQTPAALTLTPTTTSTTNYGNVLVNTPSTQRFIVTNTGTQPSGPLTLTMSGTNGALWQISSGTGDCQQNQPLGGTSSCSFDVRFVSSTNGMKTGILTASATPGSSPTLTLTANAQNPATLTVTDTAKDFGGAEVGVGSTALYTWRITNSGDVASGTPMLTNTNAAEFAVTNNCTSPIPAGMGCDIVVRFTPSAGGPRSATLSVSATPGNSVSLAATGKGQWRLTIVASFAGGVVSTLDGLLPNCGSGGCSALYDQGTPVTIRAATLAGATTHFGYWLAPTSCAVFGNGRDCAVMMNSSISANARFVPNEDRLVFVSSVDYPSTLGSVDTYDARCSDLALAANLTTAQGEFVAWISSTTGMSLTARLGTAGGMLRRVDGTLFATSLSSLNAGLILSPLTLDEYGRRTSWPVWTGTLANGSTSTENCGNWSNAGATTRLGASYTGPGSWTEGASPTSCTGTARIYCVQKVPRTMGATPSPPPSAKIAFVTATGVSIGGGLTTLDNHCNANKPTAFASRNYVAFVSTTTVPATNRLSAGSEYYRPDGMRVGTTQELGSDQGPPNGIWVSNTGSYLGAGVLAWAGAIRARDVGAATLNCNDWLSVSSTASLGSVNSAGSNFFLGSSGSCLTTPPALYRVYCLEP